MNTPLTSQRYTNKKKFSMGFYPEARLQNPQAAARVALGDGTVFPTTLPARATETRRKMNNYEACNVGGCN